MCIDLLTYLPEQLTNKRSADFFITFFFTKKEFFVKEIGNNDNPETK